MAGVTPEKVAKTYPGGVAALREVSLRVEDGDPPHTLRLFSWAFALGQRAGKGSRATQRSHESIP